MTTDAAIVPLLLAPQDTYEPKYRFKQEMTYKDTNKSDVKLRLFTSEYNVKQHVVTEQVIQRTILETGDDGRPTVERVEVLKWTNNFLEWPDREPGEQASPVQGRTFVWRTKPDGKWALYDGDGDVTEKFPDLVQRLRNWRDARMPKEPVAVGATWDVDAKTFLETADMLVPEGVEGRAVFKLEKVEEGVATISFQLKMSYRMGSSNITGEQKGTWRFDIKKGRDLAFASEGTIEFDSGRTGFGTARLERTIAYR